MALALIWFGNLQFRFLTEPDEGRYAEIPREMLTSGDWLAPHLNDIQYLEKPPLQYWATAGLYSVLGVHPWVSRLYNSGLGFLLLLLVWRSGQRLFGPASGRLSALILASGMLFYVLAHVNTLDVGLTFWLTTALLCLLRWDGDKSRTGTLWLAWLLLGLAVLQKGLIGLVLPGFALALYIVIQRDWGLVARLKPVRGLALALAVNAPWWLLMQRHNPGFVDWFFVHEHYTRFTTTEHGRTQPWWYFTAMLIVGSLPWIAPTVRGFVGGLRVTAAPRGLNSPRLLAIWAAAVFIFYSPSGSKLAPYILPMMPPLALLAGRYIAGADLGRSALRSSLLLAALMAIGLVLLPWIADRLHPPDEQIAGYADIANWGMGGGLLLWIAVLLCWLRLRKATPATMLALRERVTATLAVGMCGALALLSNGSNAIEAWHGAPQVVASLRPALAAGSRFYCVDTYPQTVIFALAHPCVIVGDHGELETQFDDGERNHLDSLDEFVSAWNTDAHAAAVLAPATWEKLRAQSFSAHVLFANTTTVVIDKELR